MTICLLDPSGNGDIYHYYNAIKSTPSYLDSGDQKIGFSNISVTNINGVITFSFARLKTMPQVINYFDLSQNQYYLLTAKGPASCIIFFFYQISTLFFKFRCNFILANQLYMHDSCGSSSSKVSFNLNSSLSLTGSSESSSLKMHAHGTY